MPFNLFDTSSIAPSQSFADSLKSGNYSVTNPQGEVTKPLPSAIPKNVPGQGFVRTTNPEDEQKIQDVIAVMKKQHPELSAISKENEREIVDVALKQYPELNVLFNQPAPPPVDTSFGAQAAQGLRDTVSDFATNTKNTFVKSATDLGGNIYDATHHGILKAPENIMKGLANATSIPFAPVIGGMETVAQQAQALPTNVKEAAIGGVSDALPAGVKDAAKYIMDAYNNLSPEQKKANEDFGRALTILGNVYGLADVAPKAGNLAQDVSGRVSSSADDISSKIADTFTPSVTDAEKLTSQESKILQKVGANTSKGNVDGTLVDIPLPEEGVTKKAVSLIARTQDPQVLAGNALKPTYAGKTGKQIVGTIKNAEKNVNEYWKLVRTGKLEGDLTDLTSTAESVVNNLDSVGADIGNMIGKTQGEITGLSPEINVAIGDALNSKTALRSPATPILKNLIEDIGGGVSVQDAFAFKRVYKNEIGKLINSGDAGTKQFQALVSAFEDLNTKIDDMVAKTNLGGAFKEKKKQYALLMSLVSDIAKSAQVEARRAPMTFTEQVGRVQAIVNAIRDPLGTATSALSREIGEMNTRGGSWKSLIEHYDRQAIKNAGKVKNIPIQNTIQQEIKTPEKVLSKRKK